MKKIILTILLIMFSIQSVLASDGQQAGKAQEDDMVLPNIFIYSPPPPTGDEVKLNDSDTVKVNDSENPYHNVRYDDSSVARYEVETEGEIIKTLYYDLKPMTPEDAVLKLQEKPADRFITFINSETSKVNVLFKLKDNKNFGIVEPDV